ncbi:MAG: NIPSNAP family protein [Alphaproteobacteria bacterium]
MALYELRTYTLYVGKMAEAVAVYQQYPWYDEYAGKLVGYFQSDIGTLNQLVHLWKYEDDADRRRHWAAVYSDPVFLEFAKRIRPLILTQENKLLQAAPWGPHP